MPLDPVELTRTFIDVPSPSGDEGDFGRLLVPILEGIGLTVEIQPVDGNRFNILATAGQDPEVVLCTHIDVVPPHIPSREDEESLYGRGACDTKGILAAMLAASEQLVAARVHRFGLLLVVAEETDSIGARQANERARWPVRFTVVGEPTESRFASGQKGAFKATLTVHGRAAHSAYPERGDSALLKMMPLLSELQEADWGEHATLGRGTFNVGELHAGVRANVIPGEATATVMIRVVDSVQATEERLRHLVAGRADVEIGDVNDPQEIHVPPGETGVPVAFNTDIPWLTRWGKPVLYGPGSILDAHSDGEFIRKADIQSSVAVYRGLVENLLATAD